jgi:hypothetical protein
MKIVMSGTGDSPKIKVNDLVQNYTDQGEEGGM